MYLFIYFYFLFISNNKKTFNTRLEAILVQFTLIDIFFLYLYYLFLRMSAPDTAARMITIRTDTGAATGREPFNWYISDPGDEIWILSMHERKFNSSISEHAPKEICSLTLDHQLDSAGFCLATPVFGSTGQTSEIVSSSSHESDGGGR